MSAPTSIERVLDAARARGLKVRQLHADDYMMQCPVHEPDGNPSVHVTYRPGEACTVVCDQHDATNRHLTLEILQALKLDWPDLYDNPRSRDAARKAYSRLWPRLDRGERRALAGTPEGKAVEAAPFTLPTAYVPDAKRGTLSEAFRTTCARLGVNPAYGPLRAVCPVCGEADALRILYAPLQQATLFHCRSCGGNADYAARLASALQLDAACVVSNGMEVMAYDEVRGVVYEYADGLRVSRSPAKQIRQHGTTRGRHPLWLAEQVAEYARAGSPVFVVEGEKDAASLWACGYAATTAAGGGGNLARTLDPASVRAVLSGATVVAVVDRDETGCKWRSQVAALLHPAVRSLTFVQATGTAHDTTDAIMANTPGEWFELLPAVRTVPPASAAPVADIPDEDADNDGMDVERFERFWLEAPYLTRIRDAARQSLAAPWGVFMALLARVATVLPPHVVVPAFVGAAPASLNVFVALVGPSGKGKGACESVAGALLPDIRDAVTSQPGSGEGLVTMFCERVADESGGGDGDGPRTILHCTNRRALLSVPEVSTLGAVMGRQGSTLAGELTKAWSGEPLGSRTKYAAGTFRAPRYGYRLCLITGVQEGNAGVLFNEADTGLPQRFLWAGTQDDERHAIDYEQWGPGGVMPLADASRFPEDLRSIQSLYRQGDRWDMIGHGDGYPLTQVRYPEAARRDTFEERRRNLVGQAGDSLDAHGNLVRLKVAALLPWLDPDRAAPLTVTDDDWRLSGEVLAYSQAVRRRCMEAERARRVETAADYARLKKAASREAEDEQDELRERTADRVRRFLAKHPGESFAARDIRNAHITASLKPYVYEALEAMEREKPPRVECVEEAALPGASKWRAV
ncbi:hypothetical protein [Bifidobacterium jacchi]|uniref:Uncharacterized protein n=1 Tax=Bifidobacterium jacchi TaxID=2490545 RepID=A0A5N5RL03_9BIFI|nr:hypothetical protein [Bifidobacterium jacchi]KAB5608002.1 hypothetical protein EHS19_02420 [Bifidobacterium jacchi]